MKQRRKKKKKKKKEKKKEEKKKRRNEISLVDRFVLFFILFLCISNNEYALKWQHQGQINQCQKK